MKKVITLLLLLAVVLTLVACGTSSTSHTHVWKGNVHSGIITCSICNETIQSSTIKSKQGSGLTSAEKAYIFWTLDNYLTATDSSGKYRYSEDEAFSKVEALFGVSRTYLNTKIWNGNAWDDYYKTYK